MKTLTRPRQEGFIKSGKHKIYFATYGNPQGVPWMFCHGGPGYHTVPSSNLKFFDLTKHYVILFDQRGAGKSLPVTALTNNTTQDLVEDMKKILEKLHLNQINLLGGSWGTTLALCFAIQYPQLVSSLVLRGVFLGRPQDIWEIYRPKSNWSQDQKEKYAATLGSLQQKYKIKNLLTAGNQILRKKNSLSQEFLKKWAAYEDLICQKGFKLIDFSPEYLTMARAISKIEIHYFVHNCFLPENYILKNINKIKRIPVKIVQGNEDMVTPKGQALALANKLPLVELYLDPQGGHSSTPAMTKQLKRMVKSLSQMKKV